MRSLLNGYTLGIVCALAACGGDDGGATPTSGAESSGTMGNVTGSDTEPSTLSGTMGAESSGTAGADESSSGSGGTPGECNGVGTDRAEIGAACAANEECNSGVCTIFTDAPVNENAVCAETPADCATRVTGTVFDLTTREPVEGAMLRVVGAYDAALSPDTATGLATGTSNADGQVDATTDGAVMEPLAIVALVAAPGGFLTATGLAGALEGTMEYEVANSIHDLWAVPEAARMTWSTNLGEDPDIDAALLPLGMKGGIVGMVRDATGAPITGAVVAPVEANENLRIRYIGADGSITADMTTDTGLFVVLGAAAGGAADYVATVDGTMVAGGRAGTATTGVLFTMVMTAPAAN